MVLPLCKCCVSVCLKESFLNKDIVFVSTYDAPKQDNVVALNGQRSNLV